jgi:hypothetical protein
VVKGAAFLVLLGSFVLFRVVTVDELRSALKRRRRAAATVTDEQAGALEARETEEISATSDATGFNSDDMRP